MFIGIAGNIGVGKSTLAEKISSRLNCTLVEESVSDNPYLDDFYADMSRWAFETQIYFICDRIKKSRDGLNIPDVVFDRTVYEDKYIFIKNLLLEGIIDPRAYDTYKKFYDLATAGMRKPDLLVYLKADVSKLKENIIKRGRENEQSLTSSKDMYISQLNVLYDDWINNYHFGPIMIIDFNNLDLYKKEDENMVIDLISKKLDSISLEKNL